MERFLSFGILSNNVRAAPKTSGNAITNTAHYMQNDHMEFLLLLFFKTA